MIPNDPHVGAPRDRVDGPAKVTGAAKYAAEFDAPGLLHAVAVGAQIARGRIASVDASAAEAVAGVVKVYTHENRPRAAWFSSAYKDQVGPPGKPLRPLYDGAVLHSDQPIALVVAQTFEAARHAATLLRFEYEAEKPETSLTHARSRAAQPSQRRSGIAPPPANRGDAAGEYGQAEARVWNEYSIAPEHHNPMECHATTAIPQEDGGLVVHDKTQGPQNTQAYLASVFGLSSSKVRVVTPFIGGGFGSGLRPQYQVFLATMAALDLKRPVRLELTRQQMFGHVHRPETINTVALGAFKDGTLRSLRHEAVAATSRFEEHQEVVVNWSGLLYHTPNASFRYELAPLDIHSPGDMRAPGAPLGVFALESAMDELAYEAGVDPVELRLKNDAPRDGNDDKDFSSKELKACLALGAERFGWAKRTPEPRSMREGRELVGYGMASGVWEAQMQKTSARARLFADGRLEVATAGMDIGTGTYTILAQIGADAFGLPLDRVEVKLGDSDLPAAPVSGGSWTAASSGTAVNLACEALREKLLKAAQRVSGSPLKNAKAEDVAVSQGRIALKDDSAKSVSVADALKAEGADSLEAEATAQPDLLAQRQYAGYTHSAVFCEVRVDEELGVVRVTRVVSAVAAGRILNPKTARSQVIGGVVWGVGMALHEEAMTDHALGRIMNANLAEYHVPVNADVPDIEVIFVPEEDRKVSPIGVKGLGEIGIVGTAAAIANAIFHATGHRVTSLPITIDKVLKGLPQAA